MDKLTYDAKKDGEKLYKTTRSIVIPAGTEFRRACNNHGGHGAIEAIIGMGKDSTAFLVMSLGAVKDSEKGLLEQIN
jgi:hypothetical protein